MAQHGSHGGWAQELADVIEVPLHKARDRVAVHRLEVSHEPSEPVQIALSGEPPDLLLHHGTVRGALDPCAVAEKCPVAGREKSDIEVRVQLFADVREEPAERREHHEQSWAGIVAASVKPDGLVAPADLAGLFEHGDLVAQMRQP